MRYQEAREFQENWLPVGQRIVVRVDSDGLNAGGGEIRTWIIRNRSS
jgi:hypothetical protein